MHFCGRVFYIFFTFARWKACSVELQSNPFGDGKTTDQQTSLSLSFESSATEYGANTATIRPAPKYSIHDSSDHNKDSRIPVSLVPFRPESGLPKDSIQTDIPMSIFGSTIAPDASISTSTVIFVKTAPLPLHIIKINSHKKSEMFANNMIIESTHIIPPTSSSHPVPSEHSQTSLAEANLMPNTYPISARMLNIPPDIISTGPVNSQKAFHERLEIHATPTVASSRSEPLNYSKVLESDAFPERDIATVPNSTRPILPTNSTKSVKVETRTNSHTMVIVPAVIGVISVLSVGFMAALYQWHQRGRRRKVYLSHPGAPPKDFAQDTGVRSPVLLPEEIEMQVGRSQSLRVRRAVILATDPPVIEADSITINVDGVTVDSSGDPITDSTPPPPPYREPPPYLPDMIIENVHAL